jgi:two-component system sensor histidine kinase KdpD
MLPHIFGKFVHTYRPEMRKSDGGEGTGLGLTITKGILEAHGGSVRAESPIAQARGTRFVLTFPLSETVP